MCGAALGLVGTFLQLYQQVEQQNYQEDLFEANKNIADASAVNQYSALQTRNLQEQESASQQITEASRKARRAAGAASAVAGATGVGGASLDALYADFERSQTEYESAVIRQTKAQNQQFAVDAKSIQANQSGQILSKTFTPMGLPSYLALGVDAYKNYLDLDTANAQAQT